MLETIEALFDGKVLRPDKPLGLKANTRVRITVEPLCGPELPLARITALMAEPTLRKIWDTAEEDEAWRDL